MYVLYLPFQAKALAALNWPQLCELRRNSAQTIKMMKLFFIFCFVVLPLSLRFAMPTTKIEIVAQNESAVGERRGKVEGGATVPPLD